jgi:hypothetical protein
VNAFDITVYLFLFRDSYNPTIFDGEPGILICIPGVITNESEFAVGLAVAIIHHNDKSL